MRGPHCQYAAAVRETVAEGQGQLSRQGGVEKDGYIMSNYITRVAPVSGGYSVIIIFDEVASPVTCKAGQKQGSHNHRQACS